MTLGKKLFIVVSLLAYLIVVVVGQPSKHPSEFTAFGYSLDNTVAHIAGYFPLSAPVKAGDTHHISYRFTPLEFFPSYLPSSCTLQLYSGNTIYAYEKIAFSIGEDPIEWTPFKWAIAPVDIKAIYFVITVEFPRPLGFYTDVPIGSFVHKAVLSVDKNEDDYYIRFSRQMAIISPIVPLGLKVDDYQPESHIKLTTACAFQGNSKRCESTTPFRIVAHNLQMKSEAHGDFREPEMTLSFYGPTLFTTPDQDGLPQELSCLLNGRPITLQLADNDEYVHPVFPFITYRSSLIPETFQGHPVIRDGSDFALVCHDVKLVPPHETADAISPLRTFVQVVHLTLGDAFIYKDDPLFAHRPGYTFTVSPQTLNPPTPITVTSTVSDFGFTLNTADASSSSHGAHASLDDEDTPLTVGSENPFSLSILLDYSNAAPLQTDMLIVCLTNLTPPVNDPVYISATYQAKNKKGAMEQYQLYKDTLSFSHGGQVKNPPCVDVPLFSGKPLRAIKPQVFRVHVMAQATPTGSTPSFFIHLQSELAISYDVAVPRLFYNLLKQSTPDPENLLNNDMLQADQIALIEQILSGQVSMHGMRDNIHDFNDEEDDGEEHITIVHQTDFDDDETVTIEVDTLLDYTDMEMDMNAITPQFDKAIYIYTQYSPEAIFPGSEYSAPFTLPTQNIILPQLRIRPALMIASAEGPLKFEGDKEKMICMFFNIREEDDHEEPLPLFTVKPSTLERNGRIDLLFVFKEQVPDRFEFRCGGIYLTSPSHTEFQLHSILSLLMFAPEGDEETLIPYYQPFILSIRDAEKTRNPEHDERDPDGDDDDSDHDNDDDDDEKKKKRNGLKLILIISISTAFAIAAIVAGVFIYRQYRKREDGSVLFDTVQEQGVYEEIH